MLARTDDVPAIEPEAETERETPVVAAPPLSDRPEDAPPVALELALERAGGPDALGLPPVPVAVPAPARDVEEGSKRVVPPTWLPLALEDQELRDTLAAEALRPLVAPLPVPVLVLVLDAVGCVALRLGLAGADGTNLVVVELEAAELERRVPPELEAPELELRVPLELAEAELELLDLLVFDLSVAELLGPVPELDLAPAEEDEAEAEVETKVEDRELENAERDLVPHDPGQDEVHVEERKRKRKCCTHTMKENARKKNSAVRPATNTITTLTSSHS